MINATTPLIIAPKYPPQNLVHSDGISNIEHHASHRYNEFIPRVSSLVFPI